MAAKKIKTLSDKQKQRATRLQKLKQELKANLDQLDEKLTQVDKERKNILGAEQIRSKKQAEKQKLVTEITKLKKEIEDFVHPENAAELEAQFVRFQKCF